MHQEELTGPAANNDNALHADPQCGDFSEPTPAPTGLPFPDMVNHATSPQAKSPEGVDALLLRSHQAIVQARSGGTGISPEELMRRIDARLADARGILAARNSILARDARDDPRGES